jgi:DNA-binding GntR family transcriptional regulator
MAQATGRTGPKYRLIADDLRARIMAGEFAAGGRIPSKDHLHEHYGAAVNTVERAIDELRREGRLETVHGSGTFVRQPPEPEQSPADLSRQVAELQGNVQDLDVRVMEIYSRLGWDHPAQQGQRNGKARHERTS